MNGKNDSSNGSNIDVAELNSYMESVTRNVNFSVESQNTKPYDINKMTGNNSSSQNSRQE